MDYTTIEDVEKKFNELYEWDKRKFINRHVDTYCNLDDYYGDYDNLFRFNDNVVLDYVTSEFNAYDLLTSLEYQDVLNYVTFNSDADELVGEVGDDDLLEICMRRFDFDAIVNKLNDIDRDRLVNFVLGDSEKSVPR